MTGRPPPASWGARAGNPGRGRRPAGTERSNAVLRSCGEMKFAASAAVPHNTGCHFGNLSCDQAFLDGAGFLSWEAFAVEIPPLVRTHQQLCRRGRGAQRCPCPRHGPSTLRSRRLENKPLCRVFPSCQGLSSPMLRCPSQRLLDRIVRRYAEVPDAGSIYMDHLTERDKLRLLYTLSVNSHPILLQVRTASPGLGTPPRNRLPVNLCIRRALAPSCRGVPALASGKVPSPHKASFVYGVGWLKPGRLLRCCLHQPVRWWRDTDAQTLQ